MTRPSPGAAPGLETRTGPAAVAELTEAIAFLQEQTRLGLQPDDARAWTDLAHVLFNVKEFIFVN